MEARNDNAFAAGTSVNISLAASNGNNGTLPDPSVFDDVPGGADGTNNR
jgi:hypothetical protein